MTVKVLALHGYTQNAKIFSQKLGAIRRSLGAAVELVFVDAPHVVPMPTENENMRTELDSASSSLLEDPELTPRAWWFASNTADGTRTYRGADESLSMLSKLLAENQFDGVLGFSQGAAMAALLTALLEKPDLHPAFANLSPAISPFKWAIFAAGFRSVHPEHQAFFATPIKGRTLHILGRTDSIVSEERLLTLVDACVQSQRRVEWHEGGHHIPSKAPWRNFLKAYMESEGAELDSIPSPSAKQSQEPRL